MGEEQPQGELPPDQQQLADAVAAEFQAPTGQPQEGEHVNVVVNPAPQPEGAFSDEPESVPMVEGQHHDVDEPDGAQVTDEAAVWDAAHNEKYSREGKTELLGEAKEGSARPGSYKSEAIDKLYTAYLNGEHVTVDFNGEPMNSREIGELGIDRAYEKYFGYDKGSYQEHERLERAARIASYDLKDFEDEYRAKKEIPSLIAQTSDLINPDTKGEWRECLETNAVGLYKGLGSKSAVDLIIAHSKGATPDELKQMLDDQHHSGASASMVRAMVKHFYKEGDSLAEMLG